MDKRIDDTQAPMKTSKFKPVVKVMLVGRDKFFEPGAAQLLTLVNNSGSVRFACDQMGISYSKAWKIIKTMESELGYILVERRQGGKNGGSAHLSQDAAIFLEKYFTFQNACINAAKELFNIYY